MDEAKEDANDDFRVQMWLAAQEGGFFYELPLGVIDRLGDGRDIVHGPWPAEECAALLKRWLEADLVQVFHESPPSEHPQVIRTLSFEEAAIVLAETDQWGVDSPHGLLNIALTERGRRLPWGQWP